jgi:hypothetical protein
MYDSENIIVYEIIKDINFLHFRFIEYGNETAHLKQVEDSEKSAETEQVLDLNSRSMSNRAIALHPGISEGVVRKWLKKHVK